MSDNLIKGLPDVIEQGMKTMNVPGATVAIVKDGKVIYSEAFGFADIKNKVKMTKGHIIPIGSSSKSITATTAVMLADEGKIDLDKPIKNYIPEFELSDPIASCEATIRDLLCHRTGMPRHDLMWINWNDLERHDLVARLKHLSSSKPFRSVWQYQNHMYATVGHLVEKITGQTWEAFVKERIFDPLNIKDTSYRVETTDRFAKLYTENDQGINEENPALVIDAMGPAGSINATAEEMAKWVLFNLNKGKVGDEVLISEALFTELHKPNIPSKILPLDFEEKVTLGYGLGWAVDLFRGHKLVEHGGNVNGASAHISMLPDMNLGCVVLTNANSSMFGVALACEIYDRFLGFEGKKDWITAYHTGISELLGSLKSMAYAIYDTKIEGKCYSHELSEYAGNYSHNGYGDAIITVESDMLHLKFHDNELELKHLHYDTFTFEMMGFPFPLSFKTGVKGNIESFSVPFEQLTNPIEFINTTPK